MKQILALLKKDIRGFWADKVAVSLTFFIPIALIFIFGSVFGRQGSSEPLRVKVAFLNQSTAPLSRKLERTLDTTKALRLLREFKNEQGATAKFDTASIKEFVRRGSAPAALVIPPDAFTDTSSSFKVQFFYDPKNDIEMQVVEGLVQQAVYGQLPLMFHRTATVQAKRFLGDTRGDQFSGEMDATIKQFFGAKAAFTADTVDADSADSSNGRSGSASTFFKNMVHIEKEQLVGREVKSPWATRNVGGWSMMFLLFALSGSATSLFDEKKSGVMLRILTSPISRTHILWSKYIFNMGLGFVQLFFLFITGWILYRIDIFSNIFNLALIVFAAATACTSFGMLLAAFSRTQAQASGWGTFLILTMSAVGGAWFPTSFMPDYIQVISKLTITYWSIEGFLQVLWRGATTLQILPYVGVLLGMSAVVNAISVWQFKKGHLL